MRLQEQVALITGSARGIGKEIAMTFAQEGAKVVISDINKSAADATAEKFRSLGHDAISLACDVTNSADAEDMVNKILDKYSRIDILVNNAGITRDN
ncbi:MAG TPA: SDR family NAD(P)-dependent oxidoreductase, partial [Candidatus Omnitrophota bacterium]|nr:SDR family NAD(P)-dependent oxidoreductase [Candidatus Omnitrophota bacterium]